MTVDFSPSAVFDSALGNAFPWWVAARMLREAATRVFDGISARELEPFDVAKILPEGWSRSDFVRITPVTGLANVYVFLAALSLENLFKAEVIRLDPGAVDGGRLGRQLTARGHELDALAERAGRHASLSTEERTLLGLASEACISWGRYPGGVAHDRGDIGPPDGFDVKLFRQTYEGLFARIERTLVDSFESYSPFGPPREAPQ